MSVNSKMTAIADAIRSKSGETGLLTMDDMAAAIREFGRSQIIVTAPTGSTVKCSMGGITKTAAEKNGTWTFQGLDLGTWTVTATLGNKTRTVTVELTRLEIRYIEIQYTLYLYKNGDECEAVTGGWAGRAWAGTSGDTQSKAPTVDKNPDHIKVTISSTSSTASAVIETQNDIDVTPYNTLFCEWKAARTSDLVGIIDRTSKYCGGTDCAAYGNPQVANEKIITAIDISSVSGAYDIFANVKSTAGSTRSIELYNLWLE